MDRKQYKILKMVNKVHKLGILAFGSLINNPGRELNKFIVNRVNNVETPFKIEYGRKSSGRGNAPTLIPVQKGGAKVKATLLILSDELDISEAMNMLYRREINKIGSEKVYPVRKTVNPNHLVIGIHKNIKNVETALTANFGQNIPKVTPELLADLAITSFQSNDVEIGRDGISYLQDNISNGIITPLTEEYRKSILLKMNANNLADIIKLKEL